MAITYIKKEKKYWTNSNITNTRNDEDLWKGNDNKEGKKGRARNRGAVRKV